MSMEHEFPFDLEGGRWKTWKVALQVHWCLPCIVWAETVIAIMARVTKTNRQDLI